MMELLNFLEMATTARLINWEPTGEEIEAKKYGYEGICRGYETQTDGFKIKTIVREKKLRRFSDLCWAISIKKDNEIMVFTEGMVGIGVWRLCRHIQAETESRDLPNQLRQHLARLMAQ